MGFEIVTPRVYRTHTLNTGYVAIHRNGSFMFVTADLIDHGITATDLLVCLVDKLARRIAFRKAREGEEGRKLKFSPNKKTALVSVTGAVSALGNKPADVARRYPIELKEDLLIIQL